MVSWKPASSRQGLDGFLKNFRNELNVFTRQKGARRQAQDAVENIFGNGEVGRVEAGAIMGQPVHGGKGRQGFNPFPEQPGMDVPWFTAIQENRVFPPDVAGKIPGFIAYVILEKLVIPSRRRFASL